MKFSVDSFNAVVSFLVVSSLGWGLSLDLLAVLETLSSHLVLIAQFLFYEHSVLIWSIVVIAGWTHPLCYIAAWTRPPCYIGELTS